MFTLYRKEQDMHETRVLMGDSKAKVGLSFMYDAPPGLEKKSKFIYRLILIGFTRKSEIILSLYYVFKCIQNFEI